MYLYYAKQNKGNCNLMV